VELIDASALMSGEDTDFRDHVHLSPEGSQHLARITARRLAEIIAADGPLPAPAVSD